MLVCEFGSKICVPLSPPEYTIEYLQQVLKCEIMSAWEKSGDYMAVSTLNLSVLRLLLQPRISQLMHQERHEILLATFTFNKYSKHQL